MRGKTARAGQRLARHLAITTAAAVWIAVPVPSAAAAEGAGAATAQIRFDIPAQPLRGALVAFGRQAGLQVSAGGDLLPDAAAPAVQGAMSPEAALTRLLAGTGIRFRISGASVILDRAPHSEGAIELGPVRVGAEGGAEAARTSDPAATEGTGSYTARAASTSTRLSLSLRETPQSVSVFTRQRIEDQNLTEISDVLEQTVGLTFVESGALGTDGNSIYSRGFAISNYQVDGVPRSTNYGFSDEISDMALFDRIEVVRGATGLLNGIGDPSATVNLIRKKPTRDFAGYVSGQIGSWNRYRVEGDVSVPLTESGNVRARMVGALQDSDSYVDRLHLRKEVLYGIIEADLSPATLFTVGVEYQNHNSQEASRSGFPLFYSDGTRTDFDRSINTSSEWGYFIHRNLSIFSSLAHEFDGGWKVKLDVEHTRRKYDGMLGYGVRGSLDRETGAGMAIWPGRWMSHLKQTSFNIHATGPFTLFGREHELAVGASHYVASRDGLDYPLWWLDGYDPTIDNFYTWNGRIEQPDLTPSGSSDWRETQSAAYGLVRLKPLDGVSLMLGGRVTYWKSRDRSFPENGPDTVSTREEKGVFTPFAGLVVDLTANLSAYASYTRIFKSQNNKDVNGDYLAPLEGNNYEAGLKAEFYGGLLNASAAVFRVEQDNFAVIDPGRFTPDGDQAYIGITGTVSKGVELEVSGEILPGWKLGGGFTYASPKGPDGERLQTYIARSSLKLFTSYEFGGALDGVTLGGNLRWQSRTYSNDVGPGGADVAQGGYAIVDLMARYQVTPHIAVALNVNNLLDKTYYTDISYFGYYGEPRSAVVSVKGSF